MSQSSEKIDVLVIWQGLVADSYRSFFKYVASDPRIRLGLVAPESFKELGSQLIECEPFKAEAVQIDWFTLKTTCIHTQIVYFHGLKSIIKTFFSKSVNQKIVISISEPYSTTSLGIFVAAVRALGMNNFSFGCFTAQNIDKRFSYPIRKMEKYIFSKSKFILSIGEEHSRVLRNHGYKGKVIDFPLWYDSRRFKAIPRSKAIQALSSKNVSLSQKLTLGFVGTISEAKGLFDLTAALSLTRQASRQSVRLLVAGNGPDVPRLLEEISRLAQCDIEAQYIGALRSDDMVSFYGAIDVLVVPSRTTDNWKEQFGRVIVEANAVAVPVIGSDSGEIPNVIVNKELVFKEADPSHLSQLIAKLLIDFANPEGWHHLKARALSHAAQYSDKETATIFVEELFSIS